MSNVSRGIDGRFQAYPFTPAEFERLYAFRQAVLARFYSDQLPEGGENSAEVVISRGSDPDTRVEELPGGTNHD
jgi:hypothetical protein